MALVPVIQPPIMKLLTTKKERSIVMEQLRPVSKTELVIFPIVVTILVSLLLPDAASLVGLLMLGNLFRVSGVTERLNKTAKELYGIDNFTDMIADETICTDCDALYEFLQEKNHPVLAMEPLM